MSIGFIGLGNIGAPMAQRLIDHPDGLVVFDVMESATLPFAEAGATVASTPAELARDASVICIVVQSEEQVRDVLERDDGILATAAPGTVVAVHSTISAEGAVGLAATAAEHGVEVIDAPISGGAMGAADGTLAVMVGGTQKAADRARPVLEHFATLVAHMGPVGSGTLTKIARNLITYVSYSVVGEAERLAEAAGLDVRTLGEVVRHSDRVTGGPGAVMVRPHAGLMAEDDGLRPYFEHSAVLAVKDLALAVEMGEASGVSTPFAQLAQKWYRAAVGLDPLPTE